MTEQPVYLTLGFSDEEWGLLTGLPLAVLTAASAAEPDGTRRTLAEGAAGLEAVAAGRDGGSPLVAAVAQEVVSRAGDPETGEELPPINPGDPEAYLGDVLDRAGAAAALLRAKVDEGEAGAYGHWVVSIAEQVVSAAPSGGMLGIGGHLVTEPERRFRDALAKAFHD
ncbi:hypothetical protein RB614_34795 [Phytohabitans sp. ZYX-F-186]|uniref:Uncharacterized protein n=1 Tax=Phytohabitans maris TaxID=3071409 RepID=A0ABU0ZRP5_9ACTN|nr:hypothetical protein [Phytohabitans sp. ZYX-F-186]MDQ7909703.1 hypothetical protein [Phytohabitans sp. ZYX-F-186]